MLLPLADVDRTVRNGYLLDELLSVLSAVLPESHSSTHSHPTTSRSFPKNCPPACAFHKPQSSEGHLHAPSHCHGTPHQLSGWTSSIHPQTQSQHNLLLLLSAGKGRRLRRRYPSTLCLSPHTRSSALPEMCVVQSRRATGYADITLQDFSGRLAPP